MRIRSIFVKRMLLAALCFLLFAGGAATAYRYLSRTYQNAYSTEVDGLRNEIGQNKKEVYTAVNDLSAGEQLTDENVERKEVLEFQSQDTFISSEDLGSILLINIPAGSAIEKNMISKFDTSENGLREVLFNSFEVPANITLNDYCDLRIAYPNGETYIVLAKKQMVRLEENRQDCCLFLTAEEIDRMQSCLVDAYLYEGSTLFLTRYLEPNLQDASIVNYTPSLQTIALIKEDPNIIQIPSAYLNNKTRVELENRLAEKESNRVTQWEEELLKNKDAASDSTANKSMPYDERYFINSDTE